MAQFKPTTEQRFVLESTGKNLIVSASAGSGKTTVMIEKIMLAIFNEKVDIDKILVLSYTKATASELRYKIEKRLQANDSELSRKQLEKLPNSDIETIHSFCQKLITRYFYILGINPAFQVVEDLESNKLKNLAFNEAIKQYDTEKYIKLLQVFSNGRVDTNLFETVVNLSRFLESNFDDKWKIRAIEFFNSEFANNYLCNKIDTEIEYYLSVAKTQQQRAKLLDFDKYVAYINNLISQIESIKKQSSFAGKITQINACDFGVLRQVKTDEDNFKEVIKNTLTPIYEFVKYWRAKNFGDEKIIKESASNCQKIIEDLFELNAIFETQYQTIKQTKSLLDYADLEKYATQLLGNRQVCAKIRQQFSYIFVDEYQDANRVQENLINKISSQNNKFMVGDVKQSIYEFRQSNPEIFLQTQKQYDNNSANGESLYLKSNFRSQKNILEFVDMIFDKIMTNNIADIDYKGTAHFVPEAKYEKDNNVKVEIDIALKTDKQETIPSGIYSVVEDNIQDEEESYAKKEAYIIANHIYSFMQTNRIYDASLNTNDKLRKAQFSDFAILIKNRTKYQEIIAQTLTELGIPVSVNTKANLKDTQEGKTLIALLKLISNSKNDIALASVMLSIFGEFTEQQLADIRIEVPEENFFDACSIYQQKQQNDISNKINDFLAFIKTMQQKVEQIGIYKALYFAFDKFDIENRLMIYPNAQNKIANYYAFANQFKNSTISLDEYLQNIICPPVPQIFNANNVVQITTMHASKGLEYKVVFVCNLSDNFNKTKHNSKIIFNKKQGLATKNYDFEQRKVYDSVFAECLSSLLIHQEFAEKIRLLYVALTRAQNNLFIIGSLNENQMNDLFEFYHESQIQHCNNYFELIIKSLPQNILEKIASEKSINFGEDNNLCIKIIDNNIDFKSPSTKIIKTQNKEVKIDNLYNYLTINYADNLSTKIALKNSVSSLNAQQEYTSYNEQLNKLLVKDHNPIGADKGVLYHKVFEKINFDKVEKIEDINLVINNFIATGELTLEEQNELNNELIYKNIILLKSLIKQGKALKEQKFMFKVPYGKISQEVCEEKIIIQGVFDLIIMGEKNILIDYKLTNIEDEQLIIRRYKKQLDLYKMAFELATNQKINECFILNINKNKLIKII